MSTHKSQPSKQPKSPKTEAPPQRRDEQERSDKGDPRGASPTPLSSPTHKRSDQEDFNAPTTEKRDQTKNRHRSNAPKRA